MKKFTLKSGNSPLFKRMGGSPMKQGVIKKVPRIGEEGHKPITEQERREMEIKGRQEKAEQHGKGYEPKKENIDPPLSEEERARLRAEKNKRPSGVTKTPAKHDKDPNDPDAFGRENAFGKRHMEEMVKGHLSHQDKYTKKEMPGVKEIDTRKRNPSEWKVMEDDKEKKYDYDTGKEIKDTETTKPVKEEEEVKEDPIVAARKKEKEEKKLEKERKKKQRRIKKHTL